MADDATLLALAAVATAAGAEPDDAWHAAVAAADMPGNAERRFMALRQWAAEEANGVEHTGWTP